MRSLCLLSILCFSELLLATDCYTNCEARFPKWYQEFDRRRCQAEKAKACFRRSKLPPTQNLSEFEGRVEEVEQRLLSSFVEQGYVVSRKASGAAQHYGDSVLFTLIGLAALPCDKGQGIRDAVLESVHRHDGRILRIDPLPASYQGNETSRDMETGALFGFALRSLKCPAEKPAFARAWGKHRDFVNSNGGKLHEGSNGNFKMTPGLRHIWDLVSYHFDYGSEPGQWGYQKFQASVVANATGIKLSKKACYPLHLNTLMIILSAKLNRPINELTKRGFCHQTRGMQLPLTEWMCGRLNVKDYLRKFPLNQYHYRHQRCGYESPDVHAGEESPTVDYLILRALAGGY